MTVEPLLMSNPNLIKEAWRQMWGCYKEATNFPLPPSCVTIAMMTVDRVALYTWVPLPGKNMPMEAATFPINNKDPQGD